MTIREDLVRATILELRRQAPGLEEISDNHVTIPRRVDLDVDELVEAVLSELYAGWGGIGEIQ